MRSTRPTDWLVLLTAALSAALLGLAWLYAPPSGLRLIVLATAFALAVRPWALKLASVRGYGDVHMTTLVGFAAVAAVAFGVGHDELTAAQCALLVAGTACAAALTYGRAASAWSAVAVASLLGAARLVDLPLAELGIGGWVGGAILALPIGAACGAAVPSGAVRAAGAVALLAAVVSVPFAERPPIEPTDVPPVVARIQ